MNTVLKSTCIYDGVTAKPFAGYIEIEGRNIKAVIKGGTDRYRDSSRYHVIDCQDRTVTAGIIDSHVHLFLGALYAATIDLYECPSEGAAAKALYEFYKDRDDTWVIGFRWSHYKWAEENLPGKGSLDRYFPDRPVIVFNDELHAVWVNSKALELCGVDKNTPDPAGGTVQRDEDGEPTGFFLEQPAMELVAKKALDALAGKEEELIEGFMKVAHSKGVTSVGAVHVMKIMKHEACKRLEEKDRLKLRVFFAPPLEMDMEQAVKLKEEYRSDKLRFIGLKGFVDGTPLGYTGYMAEPYEDRPGFCSAPFVDAGWLNEKSRECYQNGIAMRLHACGDGAVRMALHAFENARGESANHEIRNTIEHIEVLHKDDVDRFAPTKTIASIQPCHLVMESMEKHPIFQMLDPERLKLAWPGKTLQNHGAAVAFGTDYPIVDLDPVDTIYRAVKRRMEDDLPVEGWNPQEKFTVAEAIVNSTKNPAYIMGMEDKLGTLEEGKLADINVFSDNIFACENDIPSISTVLTIFDGEIVYCNMKA